MNETPTEVEPLRRLARDVKTASVTLTTAEARYLVDLYYTLQDYRIRTDSQVRTLEAGKEPHLAVSWFGTQMDAIERQARTVLDAYSAAQPVGAWARSIVGIGPVLAAGLLAHIDIEKAPTVGHIWRFAGLDPTSKWGKGEKRPWNAALKVLCWKIGESFVKVSGREEDVYGKVYASRKAQEIERNDAGQFAEQAKAALAEKKWRDDTTAKKCYLEGKLPPARIHARAKRYAVKLFLSAYHEAAYFHRFKALPPRPYVLEHLGHAHYIAPPGTELIPGWKEAREAQP